MNRRPSIEFGRLFSRPKAVALCSAGAAQRDAEAAGQNSSQPQQNQSGCNKMKTQPQQNQNPLLPHNFCFINKLHEIVPIFFAQNNVIERPATSLVRSAAALLEILNHGRVRLARKC
jgi:hypothetical protein